MKNGQNCTKSVKLTQNWVNLTQMGASSDPKGSEIDPQRGEIDEGVKLSWKGVKWTQTGRPDAGVPSEAGLTPHIAVVLRVFIVHVQPRVPGAACPPTCPIDPPPTAP